jgi:hypothetical protein
VFSGEKAGCGNAFFRRKRLLRFWLRNSEGGLVHDRRGCGEFFCAFFLIAKSSLLGREWRFQAIRGSCAERRGFFRRKGY